MTTVNQYITVIQTSDQGPIVLGAGTPQKLQAVCKALFPRLETDKDKFQLCQIKRKGKA